MNADNPLVVLPEGIPPPKLWSEWMLQVPPDDALALRRFVRLRLELCSAQDYPEWSNLLTIAELALKERRIGLDSTPFE